MDNVIDLESPTVLCGKQAATDAIMAFRVDHKPRLSAAREAADYLLTDLETGPRGEKMEILIGFIDEMLSLVDPDRDGTYTKSVPPK